MSEEQDEEPEHPNIEAAFEAATDAYVSIDQSKTEWDQGYLQAIDDIGVYTRQIEDLIIRMRSSLRTKWYQHRFDHEAQKSKEAVKT